MPLLILDLDETLLHAKEGGWNGGAHLVWEDYHILYRPFAADFLESVSRHFLLAVWTSSSADYAEAVSRPLFDGHELVFLWARDRCTRHFDPELQTHHWVKKLSKVKKAGFPLKDVLVIDDSPEKHLHNYGNLVTVSPWNGNPGDDELPRLADYLVSIRNHPNFRTLEKRNWQ